MIKANLSVEVPRVIERFVGERVMVMRFIDGERVRGWMYTVMMVIGHEELATSAQLRSCQRCPL